MVLSQTSGLVRDFGEERCRIGMVSFDRSGLLVGLGAYSWDRGSWGGPGLWCELGKLRSRALILGLILLALGRVMRVFVSWELLFWELESTIQMVVGKMIGMR